jgi:TRAP-type C4-dicarboxylate transport system substrate-binding protein
MVRQVRAGRIQAVALSTNGLSRIDRGVVALQIPLMFDSYEELDYVRDRIAPKLEQRIESRGIRHKVLFWTDGGWARFFSKKPVKTLDDIRKLRVFTSAGDAETERIWKSFRFNVVPLAATDMMTSLQTGLIDAFDVPPLFTLFDQSFTQAPNMLDLKIAPLIGGVVVSKKAWDTVPEQYRDEMLKAGREAGAKLRGEIRKLGPDSIEQMKQRGLNVIVPDKATRDAWQSEVEATYPKLRGSYCPADLFDEVKRLRDEYRKSKGQ